MFCQSNWKGWVWLPQFSIKRQTFGQTLLSSNRPRKLRSKELRPKKKWINDFVNFSKLNKTKDWCWSKASSFSVKRSGQKNHWNKREETSKMTWITKNTIRDNKKKKKMPVDQESMIDRYYHYCKQTAVFGLHFSLISPHLTVAATALLKQK